MSTASCTFFRWQIIDFTPCLISIPRLTKHNRRCTDKWGEEGALWCCSFRSVVDTFYLSSFFTVHPPHPQSLVKVQNCPPPPSIHPSVTPYRQSLSLSLTALGQNHHSDGQHTKPPPPDRYGLVSAEQQRKTTDLCAFDDALK